MENKPTSPLPPETYDKVLDQLKDTEFGQWKDALDSKKALIRYWRLAVKSRNERKDLQTNIAFLAATIGWPEAGAQNDSLFGDVCMQFAYMDHLDDETRHEEAEAEWQRVIEMIDAAEASLEN